MFCPKLPQYLPYGNSQVQAPASLCIKCMGTEFQNADQCTHDAKGKWKRSFCEVGNRSLFSLCEENEFVEAIIDRNEPPVEENTVVLRGGSGIY